MCSPWASPKMMVWRSSSKKQASDAPVAAKLGGWVIEKMEVRNYLMKWGFITCFVTIIIIIIVTIINISYLYYYYGYH